MNVSTQVEGDVLTASVYGKVDTTTAPELEAELLPHIGGVREAVIDCKNMDYISSSGLRVLLKLKKDISSVKLINVSTEVYEIMEVTGFTELLDIKKAFREVSIEGCEKLGEGYNGAVYRLDADTIVKVYRKGIPLEEIDEERRCAKTAFVSGVPTAIAYDVVMVGDSYGTVYELMDSDTLGHAFVKYPERMDELVDKYVELVRTIGNTHMKEGGFSRTQDVLRSRAQRLKDYLPEEDMALINSLFDCMPSTDTLIHGDLHPGNIMLQGDELMLIDMADLTVGPQGYEVLHIYQEMYNFMQESNARAHKALEMTVGMPRELILKVWDKFIRRYMGTDDDEQINKKMKELGLLSSLLMVVSIAKASQQAMEAGIPLLKNQLLEGVIKPNEQALRYLLSNIEWNKAHE